jgi:hypothetical protein
VIGAITAGYVADTNMLSNRGCQPVGSEPVADYNMSLVPTSNGLNVILTQTGGEDIPAYNLYIQTSQMNKTVADLTKQTTTFGVGDSVELNNVSRDDRIRIIWINNSHYQDPNTCGDITTKKVLAQFTISSKGMYSNTTKE